MSLAGTGFDSKHEFTTPTIFLGLLLCPWTWGISSKPLQCLPFYWGCSDLGRWVSLHGQSREAQPPLLTLDVGYLFSAAPAPCSHRSQLQHCTRKDVLFIIGDWNEKVGSPETPGVTGKFGLGVQNEGGQRIIEFCQENTLVIANVLFQQHKRRLYTWTSPWQKVRRD